MQLDRLLVDPPLHSSDALLANLPPLVQPVRPSIRRTHPGLELLDRRVELAAALAVHLVGEGVDFCRAECARVRRVVERKVLHAEQAVVQ